jgi:hypothetical protein
MFTPRQSSVRYDTLQGKLSESCENLVANGEVQKLKSKIELLISENQQLQKEISRNNLDSSAMSMTSEQSSIIEVESEEAKAKIIKLQSERETFARKLKGRVKKCILKNNLYPFIALSQRFGPSKTRGVRNIYNNIAKP